MKALSGVIVKTEEAARVAVEEYKRLGVKGVYDAPYAKERWIVRSRLDHYDDSATDKVVHRLAESGFYVLRADWKQLQLLTLATIIAGCGYPMDIDDSLNYLTVDMFDPNPPHKIVPYGIYVDLGGGFHVYKPNGVGGRGSHVRVCDCNTKEVIGLLRRLNKNANERMGVRCGKG